MALPLAWIAIGLVTTGLGYIASRSDSSGSNSSSSDNSAAKAREAAKQQQRQQAQQRQQQEAAQLFRESRQEADRIFRQLGIEAAALNEQQLRRFVKGSSASSELAQQLADYSELQAHELPALNALLANSQANQGAELGKRLRQLQQQRNDLAFLTDITCQL